MIWFGRLGTLSTSTSAGACTGTSTSTSTSGASASVSASAGAGASASASVSILMGGLQRFGRVAAQPCRLGEGGEQHVRLAWW